MKWNDLTHDEKTDFTDICTKLFGKTNVFAEVGGQPLYFDEDMNLIDTEPLIVLISRKNKINKILNNINGRT